MAKKKLRLVRRSQVAVSDIGTTGGADNAAPAEDGTSTTAGTTGGADALSATGGADAAAAAVASASDVAAADPHFPHENRRDNDESGLTSVGSSVATNSVAFDGGASDIGSKNGAPGRVGGGGVGNRPRGLSLDIEDPASQPAESADPHEPVNASGRISPGAGPSAMVVPTPTHKSPKHTKHGVGASPRKKTPPTDEEDGMASSDDEGGRTSQAAGKGGSDYIVVHEGQTQGMAGVDPASRGGSADSNAGGPPLSPTHRGGDEVDAQTRRDIQEQIEREKEKIRQKKEELLKKKEKEAGMIRVADHPKYKEYVRFDKLGVTGRLLERMMKDDGLYYDNLEDPDDLISWDGKVDDDSSTGSDSSEDSLEELEFDEDVIRAKQSRDEHAAAAAHGESGYNTHAHGEAIGGGHSEAAGAHGGSPSPPVSPKNQEVAEVFKAFVEGDSDNSSDEESELDPEEMLLQEDPNAGADDGPKHNFLIGDRVFKVERMIVSWQILSLMFKIDGLKLPPYFRAIAHWSWCFTDGVLYAFVRLLGIARYFLEPVLDDYVGKDLLLDPYYYSDVMYFVVAVSLGLAGTYALLNVWIISDYTDPQYTDRWQTLYIKRFWRVGLWYTLKYLGYSWLFFIFAGLPLAYWFGYAQDHADGDTSGNGGRSFSTKFFDPRYMATRGNVGGGKGEGVRTGSYKQAGSLVFVGVTLTLVLWLMFLLVVLVVRSIFKAKTTHNEQYTSIITLKEIVKNKIKSMLVVLTWLYIPISYLVIGALLPQWDWNDTHAVEPRRKYNYHTPCYFMSFPPRDGRSTTFSKWYDADWYKTGSGTTDLPKDQQGLGEGFELWQHREGTYRTDETVHCYTSYGVALYCFSTMLFFAYVIGLIWLYKVTMTLTYKALESSDWFFIFLHANKKFEETKAEVNLFAAKQIIKHQLKIRSHFWGIWWDKTVEINSVRYDYFSGILIWIRKSVWKKVTGLCKKKPKHDLNPIKWAIEVTERVRVRGKARRKAVRKRHREKMKPFDPNEEVVDPKTGKKIKKPKPFWVKGFVGFVLAGVGAAVVVCLGLGQVEKLIEMLPLDDELYKNLVRYGVAALIFVVFWRMGRKVGRRGSPFHTGKPKRMKLDEIPTDPSELLPKNKHSRRVRWFVNTTAFQSFIMLMTFASLLEPLGLLDFDTLLYDSDKSLSGSGFGANDDLTLIFVLIFLIEFILMIIAYCRRYWFQVLNLLDFFLLLLGFIDVLVILADGGDGGASGGRALKGLKGLKSLKGLKGLKSLKALRGLRALRSVKYLIHGLKEWLLLTCADTEPTTVIIDGIVKKKAVARWRLRRSLPVKFENMKKAYENLKHEYAVGFGEFTVDHDLIITQWEGLIDTCAYAYLIAPFKHSQYGWRVYMMLESLVQVGTLRWASTGASAGAQCLIVASLLFAFNYYTLLRRPFLYERERAMDQGWRLFNAITYLFAYLHTEGYVPTLAADIVMLTVNAYGLLKVLVWLEVVDEVVATYLYYRNKLDVAVIDFVFSRLDIKNLTHVDPNYGLKLLQQWDQMLKEQRMTALLTWPRTIPDSLLTRQEKRKIVKWAAWRGLFLDQIRNETGVTVLHNAMVKAEADSIKWLIHTYPKLLTAEDEARDTPIVTALKECAQTLISIHKEGLDKDKEWARAKFFEILASEQIQSTKVRWNVHHFKAFNDIAVEWLGALTQHLALVFNLNPPKGFRRISEWGQYPESITQFMAECFVACRDKLEIDGNELGDIGSPSFVNIMRSLEITQTQFTRPSTFFMSYPLHVVSISARYNRLDSAAGAAIASMLLVNKTVRRIDISHNNLDDEAGVQIADALKHNTTVTSLDMAHNLVRAAAGEALASMIKRNKVLVSLDVGHNHMGPVIYWKNKYERVVIDGAGKHLGAALRVNKTLTDFDASHNEFGPAAGDAFGESMRRNRSLTRLNLNNNCITKEGAKRLAYSLQSRNHLTSLDISHNLLGADSGMLFVRAVRRMPVLATLNLSENLFGTRIGRGLMLALQDNHSLTALTAKSNFFGPTVAHELAIALKVNNTLTQLDLSQNRLGLTTYEGGDATDAGKHLGDALVANKSMVNLDISNNHWDQHELTFLTKAVHDNTTLLRLAINKTEFEDISTLQLASAVDVRPVFRQFETNHCGIGPRAGAVFTLSMESLTHMLTLNLDDNMLGEKVAHRIAEMIANKHIHLENLKLAKNDFGPEGCLVIAEAFADNRRITSVDLSYNRMDEEAGKALAEGIETKMDSGRITRKCKIRWLNLYGNPIGSNAGVEILTALSNDVPEYVNLGQCELDHEVGEQLGRALRVPTIGWTELNLENNKLGKDGVNPIFWALRRNVSLVSLDLSSNEIGPKFGTEEDNLGEHGTSVVAAIEMNFTLRWLDLGNNGISATAGVQFCEALKENPSLVCLYMENNELDANAGMVVAEKLMNDRQLRYVNLTENRLSWEAGRDIAQALAVNRTLTHLDVGGNGMGDNGPFVGELFATAITKNTALRVLNLESNRLGPTAGAAIAKAITRNNTLIHLKLENNRFDSEVGEDLVNGLKVNKNLLSLGVSGVEIGCDADEIITKEMKQRQPGITFDLSEHDDA